MKYYSFWVTASLFIHSFTQAQKSLKLEEAIAIALQQNYEIELVKNELIIAQQSDFKGNANEQMTYNLGVAENIQLTGVNQKLANGNEISRVGVPAHAFSTQFVASYPIFNRFRVKATKGRFKEQINIADARVMAQIQSVVAQVMLRYYDMVRQQKLIKALQKTLAVSEQRLELVKIRQNVGTANNTDLYLAQLDLNARLQDIAQQQLLLEQGKIDFNTLLNAAVTSDFELADSIVVNTDLNIEQIKLKSKANPELLMAEGQIKVLDWLEKETHAQRLPTARINAGAAASLSNTTAGFLLQNISYGPYVGVNLSIPLFNKKIFDRQEDLVLMQKRSREIQKSSLENSLEGSIERTWKSYQIGLERIKSESANTQIAQNYLDLVLQRYQLNQSNAIELREAQRSYEEAFLKLTNMQYAAKVAEIELNRISSQLIEK
jgi:outer membrane protein